MSNQTADGADSGTGHYRLDPGHYVAMNEQGLCWDGTGWVDPARAARYPFMDCERACMPLRLAGTRCTPVFVRVYQKGESVGKRPVA